MKSALVGNTHLVAGGAAAMESVLGMLAKEGIRVQGNPDVYVRTYQHFGVEEARELRERAGSRAINSERRVFVVATPSMTNEAQNALLKTLEEPPANALFFFVLPAPEALLPTLRSRAQMLTLEGGGDAGVKGANAFLAADAEARFDMLKPLLEKGDDEKRDLGAILAFLSSVEQALADRKLRADTAEGLKALYRARAYITDKGALVKPLLEQVALLTPRV